MRKMKIIEDGLVWRIMNYELWANKLWALGAMLLGYLSINLLEGDATVFILTLMFSLPALFAKENIIG